MKFFPCETEAQRVHKIYVKFIWNYLMTLLQLNIERDGNIDIEDEKT
jgi:hypothetical protein